jgi:8-oxo-dGTP pyrophosphatase MutT (NUDIX family)
LAKSADYWLIGGYVCLFKKRGQMYKIYVNGQLLILLSEQELHDQGIKPDKYHLVSAYVGKKKIFRQHVDLLNKSTDHRIAYIWSRDLTAMWQEFTDAFTLIVAAGGLVTNPRGEILVFLRHGTWDMPKGKIDPGEMPPESAIREVQEECGLDKIELGPFLCHSYHTYQGPKKVVLKKTWWYAMTTEEDKLTPQVEEGIEIVQWEPLAQVRARIKDFYPNLWDVILMDGPPAS